MVTREVLLAKPKHQYHSSQWGVHVYDANHEKKGDYYMNLCLSKSKDELQFLKW